MNTRNQLRWRPFSAENSPTIKVVEKVKWKLKMESKNELVNELVHRTTASGAFTKGTTIMQQR